jgi:hypothetical protein
MFQYGASEHVTFTYTPKLIEGSSPPYYGGTCNFTITLESQEGYYSYSVIVYPGTREIGTIKTSDW